MRLIGPNTADLIIPLQVELTSSCEEEGAHRLSAMNTDARPTVVIAEDESLIRLDLAEMLTELGYNVVGQVGDGAAAVRLVKQLTPTLVILDVKMPVLDGLSAAERIGELGTTAIIMLTAFSQRELVERASEAGAMAYLVKPFSETDLAPTLEVARARHSERLALEAEIGDLISRLEARKVVEKAKGALQRKLGLDESAAFRWLQKAAMDRRMSMADVSAVVITELVAHAEE